jgi:hypothetical protein
MIGVERLLRDVLVRDRCRRWGVVFTPFPSTTPLSHPVPADCPTHGAIRAPIAPCTGASTHLPSDTEGETHKGGLCLFRCLWGTVLYPMSLEPPADRLGMPCRLRRVAAQRLFGLGSLSGGREPGKAL